MSFAYFSRLSLLWRAYILRSCALLGRVHFGPPGLVATIFAISALSMHAQAVNDGACVLSPLANDWLTLSLMDSTPRVASTGQIKAVMLFIEFPDAPATETTQQLVNLLVPLAQQWYSEVSYGRVSLSVTPVSKWYRMSKSSTSYSVGGDFASHRAYAAEAITLADSDVDFSQFSSVYIISAPNQGLAISPVLLAAPGSGIKVDGVEVRHVVTMGNDIRRPDIPNFGAKALTHEIGHTLGLPDLYSIFNPPLYGGTYNAVGIWDPMSWIGFTWAHFTAWQKLKLGYLDAIQIPCLTSGTLDAELTPLSQPGGLKAIAMPLSSSKALVVEVRQPLGSDASLCNRGVIVYSVDASVRTGEEPMHVFPARPDGPTFPDQCGPAYNAPWGVGTTFSDASSRASVQVLESRGQNYFVRATNPLPVPSLQIGALAATQRLTYVYEQGGKVPPPQTIQLNAGLLPLRYTANATKDWLQVSPSTGLTPGTLSAAVLPTRLTVGVYVDDLMIVANGVQNSPLHIAVELSVTEAPDAPQVSNIVNAASGQSGVSSLNTWMSIFGQSLSSQTDTATTVPFPVDLAGVRVLLGGLDDSYYPVPLSYVSPTQINFLVPNLGTGQAKLKVINNTTGKESVMVEIQLAPVSPSVFLASGAIILQDSAGRTLSSGEALEPGGVYVLYGTGFGFTNPALKVNEAAPIDILSRLTNETHLSIADREADVLFAGLTPGAFGLYQINFRNNLPSSSGSPQMVTGKLSIAGRDVAFPVRVK